MKRFINLLKKRNSGGYTLVEVVVATALLGILIVGVLLFMTPVFGMMESNKYASQADRLTTTMETYISKTLRRSLYVKIFTGADDTDATSMTGAIRDHGDYKELVTFMNTGDNKNKYKLNCLSVRYEVDQNPRNNSEGDTAMKYMLYNEKINTTHYTLDDAEQLVFDESFYEDLYPTVSIETLKVHFDSSGAVIDPLPDGVTPAVTRTPGFIFEIGVFSNESMNDVYRVFTGKSVIECNNIKSAETNPQQKYKIYDTTELTTGKDIYIFYITRNLDVAP